MTLDEFLQEQRERLSKFEAYWRKNNARDPDAFPMAMDEDNSGLWFEQFDFFDDEFGL